MVLINVHVSDDKEKYEPVLSPLMATSYVSYNPKQAFLAGDSSIFLAHGHFHW